MYLSWVLGHTHAHNSMQYFVQSLAQAHVHVCTEYCTAFAIAFVIAFFLLLFPLCQSTYASLFVEGLERDMDIFYFPFR